MSAAVALSQDHKRSRTDARKRGDAESGLSGAFLCCAAMALSEDHKPNRTDERSRIEAAGGVVVWAGTWRVGGVLAVSRAFGDRLLKRCARAQPGSPCRVRRCVIACLLRSACSSDRACLGLPGFQKG